MTTLITTHEPPSRPKQIIGGAGRMTPEPGICLVQAGGFAQSFFIALVLKVGLKVYGQC